MIRRGGHAPAVPPAFSIEVVCPEGEVVESHVVKRGSL
jgi:hypothetical protein